MAIRTLIIILLFSLTGCSSQNINIGNKELKDWKKPNSPLKLKTSKDKILAVREIEDIRCNEYGQNCINKGKIKKYYYTTDKKIDKIKYKKDDIEYEEDLERRTTTRQYFTKKKSDLLGSTEEETELVRIYGASIMYKDYDTWYELTSGTTTIIAYEEQTTTSSEKLGASGDPIIASAGDGWIQSWSNSYSTARSGGGSIAAYPTGAGGPAGSILGWSKYISTYYLNRVGLVFDTDLGVGTEVTSASIFTYCEDWNNQDGADDYIVVVNSSWTDETGIATGDWGNFGTTNYSDQIDYNNLAKAGYTEFTLNTAGEESIDTEDYSFFGMKDEYDINNTTPTGLNRYMIYMSEAASGKKPYIEIEYTGGGGGAVAPKGSLINFQ